MDQRIFRDHVCFQEHFKKNVGNFFSSYFPGFSSYIVPATRGQNQESGRPKGGLAQLHTTNFQTTVKRITTSSPRLQAQILELPNISLLWINTYFPTDPPDSDVWWHRTQGCAENIMDTTSYDHVLICGDLNWHRNRLSGFCAAVKDFVDRIGLVCVWDKFPVSHTLTMTACLHWTTS